MNLMFRLQVSLHRKKYMLLELAAKKIINGCAVKYRMFVPG
jgi:hypothetical protein